MKYILLICSFALFLCACEPTDECTEPIESTAISEVSLGECVHEYGSEPIDTVGNIEFYECQKCGERKVVANGSLIGGE